VSVIAKLVWLLFIGQKQAKSARKSLGLVEQQLAKEKKEIRSMESDAPAGDDNHDWYMNR
jgi:hypothetical protein